MNQPWECTRCHKINAPWLPFCDCKLETGGGSVSLGVRIYGTGTLPQESDRCLVCNGHHDQGVQCTYLRFT